jgi:hypothetical protein
MGAPRLEELRSQLEAIAEELGDIGHAKLREVLDTDSADMAAEERRLTRARRSVLKAASLLAGDGGAEEEA